MPVIAIILGRMPSAVGYQPTLSTEMGSFQERIVATDAGSITSIQAKCIFQCALHFHILDVNVSINWVQNASDYALHHHQNH